VRRGRVALARRRLRRRTQAELSALPDKVLNDIGILRGDIPAVARSMTDKALRADRTAHRETEASAAPPRPALEVIPGGRTGQAVAASVDEERLRGCG
ncbi:MAG TPA: DUF1127 domain-containing protein, partial [Kiloniellales bacterium]|nr:DUF1127 domain-containing protein [Kiloniellales bacterium]